MIRQPIITVVGHVDHGKTSLLDKIRGTAVTATEAGKITQAIGASIIPASALKKICGPLLDKIKLQVNIPGLLFIDTPGHAAFINLRKRGGALADIAVLVIDINEGLMPQTIESIDILKNDKTPFIIAANKIDKIPAWSSSEKTLLESIQQQSQRTQEELDKKLYEMVGKLFELGLNADRFDRVSDYTKQFAIVPVSALSGEGVPELLMVITGMAQKYLEAQLNVQVSGDAKGTVLEVKEEKGLGTTIDAIIYEGCMKTNDTLVIAGMEEPIITKIRILLQPEPLAEMRLKKSKFQNVKQVYAATGVKISAPDIDNVIAGMPLRTCTAHAEKIANELQKEVEQVFLDTDDEGVIVKADTLGSLEALMLILREKQIQIKFASIGKINKKDIADAEAEGNKNPFHGVIIAFNTEMLPDADTKNIKVMMHDVIYHIVDEYTKWKEEKTKTMEAAQLDSLVRGGKFRILTGYIFRQSNPAVVGIEVLAGRIKAGEKIMTAQGKSLTTIKTIEEEKKPIPVAEAGKHIALSMDNITIGRQVHEGDILFIEIPEEDFRKMKELRHYLNKSDVEVLKETAEIKRKENPVWGI